MSTKSQQVYFFAIVFWSRYKLEWDAIAIVNGTRPGTIEIAFKFMSFETGVKDIYR
jgi:hypothetical protein